MHNLEAARSQMALSLGFHIVFSCIGMVLPVFMAIAHFLWLRTGRPVYRNITVAWSKGAAIFFATGAVSGTVLSFEMGLLWPEFMKHAGPIFGMPFSLEGTAFFIEAIALGFFLYGWERLNKWFHWFTGLAVGICGIVSGVLVVAANSWMNSPAGFDLNAGVYTNIDPVKAMFNRAWASEALHMSVAAFMATGFAVAGIHAVMILRKDKTIFHCAAFRLAALLAAASSLLQPLSGDLSARFVAKNQPAKLAAMEAHFTTEKRSALIIGGIPDVRNQTVHGAIRIPGLLSIMVYGNPDSAVKGLDVIPADERPPVAIVHYAFQVMVAIAMALGGLSLLYLFSVLRKREWRYRPWMLRLFAAATPLGFIAVEAGWTVTEVGRQPWIIQGIMRTSEAVTPMPGVAFSLLFFALIYVSLAVVVTFLLFRQIRAIPKSWEDDILLPIV